MARPRLLSLSLAAAVVLLVATDAAAQRYQPFGPLDFEHDAQIFAPAEISSFSGGPDPNVGLFFTYDRMNLNVSRSQTSISSFEGDWTWGNRYNLGYMRENDKGWLVEIIHLDGPNVHTDPTSLTNDLVNGPGTVQNSIHFGSVEVMRQWRWKPLHYGSHLDMFLGFRYTHVEHQDAFPYITPQGNFNGVVANNHIYGPEIGLRWFKQKRRWTFSAEGRYFYAYNDQFFGSGNVLDADGNVDQTLTPVTFRTQRWVHAGNVRLETTYDVTKSFALAAGWDFTYLGNGVARGVPPFHDQDLWMTGLTIGFKLNR
jgi:hypothetical protein